MRFGKHMCWSKSFICLSLNYLLQAGEMLSFTQNNVSHHFGFQETELKFQAQLSPQVGNLPDRFSLFISSVKGKEINKRDTVRKEQAKWLAIGRWHDCLHKKGMKSRNYTRTNKLIGLMNTRSICISKYK